MRSKRKEQETGLDKTVGVALTPAQETERAGVIAAKVVHVEALRKKLADDSKEIRNTIKAEEDEVRRLARVIIAHEENVKQGDLFVDGKTEAQRALAEVAKAAGENGNGKPLPSDPHGYVGDVGTAADLAKPCGLCGGGLDDPIHAAPGEAEYAGELIRDHQYIEAVRENVGDVAKCTTCGGVERAHAFIAGVDPVPEEATGEPDGDEDEPEPEAAAPRPGRRRKKAGNGRRAHA